MSDELKKLADARNDLLLAEMAAWLHDMGKCTSEFVYYQSARSTNNFDPYKAIFSSTELQGYQFSSQRIQERLDEANQQYALHMMLNAHVRQALDARFSVDRQHYTFREAVYFSRPRFAGNIGRPLGRTGEPLDLLAYCHGEGHSEKEEPSPSITPGTVGRHSAFGFPLAELPGPNNPKNLKQRLNNLNWERLLQRGEREPLRQLFSEALGDTRFPINEITLWDWSTVVASLYKAELARYYFTGEWRTRNNLCWRLLRVNFDVLGLYAKAIKIADLLGYKERIELVCEKVKHLIEEEYPLGNEIYRDTTGIYFTFPETALPDDLKNEIRRLIEDIEPELAPRIAVGEPHGSNATAPLKRLLADGRKEACKVLAQPFETENLSPYWQSLWEKSTDGKREVCPVCRLRPMEEHKDACVTCIKRRDSRIGTWLKNPSQTIWIDEIADHNDRVALIVGKFGLDDWLSGDLVQTMLVKAVENEPAACMPKNPSPARLRRVWETCQKFWTETIENQLLSSLAPRQRWVIEAKGGLPPLSALPNETVCDGALNGEPVSVWRKGDSLLTISFVTEKPVGRLDVTWERGRRKQRATWEIRSAQAAASPFATFQPSLTLPASPDQFLALVPAADALEIAERTREEYTRQFGKVQNRLPLFLGLVFSLRKTPLMAVLDTARRMLAIPLDSEQWTVKGVDNEKLSAEGWPDTVKVSLEKNGQQICFKVKTVMGDATTKDVWYPYFFLEGDPGTRSLRFQPDGCWLLHVNDLHAGDPVRVTPSRFACLFLESTAQRFRFDPVSGTMLLDELPRLIEMWNQVCGSPDMSDTRLQAIDSLFEAKRQEWKLGGPTLTQPIIDDTFRNLVETTLTHQKVQGVKPEDVLNGRFSRCLDLHLHILKRRVSDERKNKEARNEPATL